MAYGDTQYGGTVFALAAAIPITLAGTVSKGDAVGYSSGWVRAFGGVAGVIQGRLVALQSGVLGDIIMAAFMAEVGGRFSEMTPGDPLYVSEEDAGQYEEVAPNTTDDATTIVGYAITADEALIRLTETDSLAPA